MMGVAVEVESTMALERRAERERRTNLPARPKRHVRDLEG